MALMKKIANLFLIMVVITSLLGLGGCAQRVATVDIDDENLDVSQTYFSSHQVAKGENGYYFFEEYGEYILYFDEATKETIPLCSRAECTHNNKLCMAYIGGSQLDYSIYYYNNRLYWLTSDGGMVKLMECMADGSNRKIVGELYPYNIEASEGDLMFAGEHMYFTENGISLMDTEGTVAIKRMALDGGIVENVYEYSGVNCNIQWLKAYSGKVYFIIIAVERTGDKTFESKGKGLYAYDYETGKTELVVDDSVKNYCIDTKNKALYYYVYNKGLYRSKDGKTEQIYKATEQTGFCDLSFDGEYVYMDNATWMIYSEHFMGLDYDITSTMWIFDNGELKTTINVKEEKIVSIYNGDSNYFFASRSGFSEDVKMEGVSLFSKKEFFETGKINWIEGDYK